MAWLSEQILYWLVKRLYRSEVAHSASMKKALTDLDRYHAYRAAQAGRVVAAAQRYGVNLDGKELLDLGCNDGAITPGYLQHGARRVIGVDIDAAAIELACKQPARPDVEYRLSTGVGLPLADDSIDVIVCFDVFEHVARPAPLLAECKRVLRGGGQVLIGTWGWYHPFAPHLWSVMPVPWAHVFFSERTMLRTCRRVYHSPWYVPNMHDLDAQGNKLADKYREESISPEYLNKYLIRDFEKVFKGCGMSYQVNLEPFGSRYARWTKSSLRIPWLREFFTSYLWAVLRKDAPPGSTSAE